LLKLFRQAPLSAKIGMVIVLLNILAAVFAAVIAPYGESSVVGDVWEVF